MADDKKDNRSSGIPKYRFLEEFESSIDPETGEPYEDLESPTVVKTGLFGDVLMHRIAKVNVQKTKVTQEYVDVDFNGRRSVKTREVEILWNLN